MRDDLKQKVENSIKLLQAVQRTMLFPNEPIELAYSGGKDSDVILHLSHAAGINVQPIYKNTTIDPPGTIQHALNVGAIKRMPKRSFFDIMDKKGYPSRFERFCCKELKEYKISNMAIMGIRRDESTKRAENYKEPICCRKYSNGRIDAIYPILEWSDEDVRDYILENNIQCAPVYYENGEFDVTKRLGCMCCPLASRNKRIEEFKKYPGMVRAYLKHGDRWFDTHPNIATVKQFPDAMHYLVLNVFCDSILEYEKLTDGLDVKNWLSDQFEIEL